MIPVDALEKYGNDRALLPFVVSEDVFDILSHFKLPHELVCPKPPASNECGVRSAAGNDKTMGAQCSRTVDIEKKDVMPFAPKCLDIFPNLNIGKRVGKFPGIKPGILFLLFHHPTWFFLRTELIEDERRPVASRGHFKKNDVGPIFLDDVRLAEVDVISLGTILLDELCPHTSILTNPPLEAFRSYDSGRVITLKLVRHLQYERTFRRDGSHRPGK